MNSPHTDGPRYTEQHWQSPPEQLWQRIEQQLESDSDTDANARRWPARLALAASLCVATGLMLFVGLRPHDSHAAAIERWQGYNHKLVQQIDLLDDPDALYRVDDLLIRQHLKQQIRHIDQTLAEATRDQDRLILHQHRAATLVDLLNLQAQAAAANLTSRDANRHTADRSQDAALYPL